jgi:hypothetical protein
MFQKYLTVVLDEFGEASELFIKIPFLRIVAPHLSYPLNTQKVAFKKQFTFTVNFTFPFILVPPNVPSVQLHKNFFYLMPLPQ